MIQDSLTQNSNILPPDNASLFKTLVRSQDEVPSGLAKTFFIGNSKDHYPQFYIKQTAVNTDKFFCSSVFHTDKKQFTAFEQKEIIHKQSDSSFYLLMFCLVVGAVIYFARYKRISQVFKAFYLPHFTNQLVREGLVQREFFVLPLLLINYVSMAMLINKFLNLFFGIDTNIRFFLLILGVLIALSVVRTLIINLAKWTFRTYKETSEYNTNHMIFSIVIGMFLVPSVFLIYYLQHPFSEFLLYFVLIITALLIIYRTFRSFLIGMSSERHYLYYFILYLCTIEILPLVVTVKLLVNLYFKGVLIV
jgi:hypothetical protein